MSKLFLGTAIEDKNCNLYKTDFCIKNAAYDAVLDLRRIGSLSFPFLLFFSIFFSRKKKNFRLNVWEMTLIRWILIRKRLWIVPFFHNTDLWRPVYLVMMWRKLNFYMIYLHSFLWRKKPTCSASELSVSMTKSTVRSHQPHGTSVAWLVAAC